MVKTDPYAALSFSVALMKCNFYCSDKVVFVQRIKSECKNSTVGMHS